MKDNHLGYTYEYSQEASDDLLAVYGYDFNDLMKKMLDLHYKGQKELPLIVALIEIKNNVPKLTIKRKPL